MMKAKIFISMSLLAISTSSYAVVHKNITFKRECVYPEIKFPVADVKDNMSFFRQNMGRWQITELAGNYVIMGSGYNYQIKKGRAGYTFCVSDGVITQQSQMNDMYNNPQYFKNLLLEYNPLTVITSDGNWLRQFTLPQLDNNNNKNTFVINRKSTYPVRINFLFNDKEPYIEVPKNTSLYFYFNGNNWLPSPKWSAHRQHQLNEIKNNVQIFTNNINKYGVYQAATSDGNWVNNLTLPESGINNGRVFMFNRRATWATTIKFDGRTITPGKDTTTYIIRLNDKWAILGEKEVIKARLFQHGSYKGQQLPLTGNITDLGSFNKQMSAIKVEDGWRAIIYSGRNYTGESRTISAQHLSWIGSNWNDRVQSVRFEKRSHIW
ncbi:hypothetical protein NFHSH190041_23040 [Shewanella sp. NFH-SH190041]|uniref:hypothetical protein n=1 Tax=Shewanella sp. NFH-SH190041 TaxID=2950245 RepID=UPI002202FB74|nr:hypothetical protein [Shewanella sp. NFH-SH190041]BDM64852.1 hypothetical protein NFHSH190041_23040 [Shewanella sp. NFH-SH190041]